MNSKKKFILFFIFIIISLLVATISGYLGTSLTSIGNFFSANPLLSALMYSLLFIILTTFSFSVSVMTSLGTLLFPSYQVVIYSMIGIMGSSIIDFYISRKLGKNYIQNYVKKRGGKVEKLEEIIEKNPFKTITILSAIFFVPPTIPNFLGGIMNLNLKNYSVATFIGNIPNTIFTVYLITGFIYSNKTLIYVSLIGLILTTLIALYFYNGEIKELLKLSFPSLFHKKNLKIA